MATNYGIEIKVFYDSTPWLLILKAADASENTCLNHDLNNIPDIYCCPFSQVLYLALRKQLMHFLRLNLDFLDHPCN
jgi:hypothetical protein